MAGLRESRIQRAAGRLACTPDALDILHASLSKVVEQPLAERYRKINVSTGAFKDRVASRSTAGAELLYAVGYEPMHGFLVLQKHDVRLLRLALQELDAARSTPAYLSEKARQDGERARQAACAGDASAASMRRASFLAKVPPEPKAGSATSACVITVRTPGGTPAGTRRFDSDHTLDDLVHYIRSLEGVPSENVTMTIENVTTRPARRLNPASEGSLSLYSLDLWPRGQVQVRVGA